MSAKEESRQNDQGLDIEESGRFAVRWRGVLLDPSAQLTPMGEEEFWPAPMGSGRAGEKGIVVPVGTHLLLEEFDSNGEPIGNVFSWQVTRVVEVQRDGIPGCYGKKIDDEALASSSQIDSVGSEHISV